MTPYLLHLRLNFQLMLAPIFLWGAVVAGGRWSGRLAAAFVIIHLCLYGGATAFNSAYDRDDGPVGGLKRPPPVPRGLLHYSLLLLAAGAAAAPAVSLPFAAVYLSMALLGLAYSHPGVRLKSRPWASIAAVAFGQGWLGFLAGYLAAGGEVRAVLLPGMLEAGAAAVLVTATLYPLTQLYQVAADRRSGDRTFGAVYGERGCFLFSIAGALLSAPLLADYSLRRFSTPEALLLAGGLVAAALLLAGWSRRFRPEEIGVNYDRVMRLAYAAAALFGVVLLFHLRP